MDLMQGTLDLLILRVLATKPRNGYEIAKRISLLSDELFTVGHGSLYPALQRLSKRGWIVSEWGKSDTGREAKFYELTKAGRLQVGEELTRWESFSAAMNVILKEG